MQFILEEESGTYILTGVLCFTINVASKRDNNQQAGMPPLRAGKTVCKRSGRGKKSSMTFSAASFRGLRKCGSCRASVLCQMSPDAFSVIGNRMLLCMEICE